MTTVAEETDPVRAHVERVMLIANLVDGAVLMAAHPDDGAGHCRSCRGAGSAWAIWPCSARRLGEQVAELQRHRKMER